MIKYVKISKYNYNLELTNKSNRIVFMVREEKIDRILLKKINFRVINYE